MSNRELMRVAVSAMVPLEIMELERRGGITDWHIEQAREISKLIAEQGDVLQYGGGKRGQAGSLMAKLCEGLAVLAFMPGGVTFAGQHFEAHPTYGTDEEVSA
jgi:hypothetical protein